MENSTKYLIIVGISIVLFIPILFGIYVQFFFIRDINPSLIFFFLFGLLILLAIGRFIEICIFNKDNVQLMRKHDVTNALINGNNRLVIWVFFPLTMIMEELIFRYYLVGFLIKSLNLEIVSVLFISSLIFSLYHIHTWFSFKNLTLLLINLLFPFLMGIYLGFVLLNFGIIACILIHSILAFSLYYSIYRRYFRIEKNIKKRE